MNRRAHCGAECPKWGAYIEARNEWYKADWANRIQAQNAIDAHRERVASALKRQRYGNRKKCYS